MKVPPDHYEMALKPSHVYKHARTTVVKRFPMSEFSEMSEVRCMLQ